MSALSARKSDSGTASNNWYGAAAVTGEACRQPERGGCLAERLWLQVHHMMSPLRQGRHEGRVRAGPRRTVTGDISTGGKRVGQPARPGPPASPAATGGQGTVAEHRLGGRMLAALLLQGPVEGLGGVLVPTSVAFQAASPVDDLVVVAEGAGEVVTWHVAGRIRPVLAKGSAKTVALFADYLTVLSSEPAAAETGRLRLGLAALPTHGPATELASLCRVAQGAEEGFREKVARRSKKLQARLEHVDGLVAEAGAHLGWPSSERDARDWSWLLLSSLDVVQASWEDGGDGAVSLTNALRWLTGGDLPEAEALRHLLSSKAADHAAAGVTVTRQSLLRSLHGRVRMTPGAPPAPVPVYDDRPLAGLDQDASRVFVSSRMDGSLDKERRVARDTIRRFPHLRPWLWEEDSVPGPLPYEQHCLAVAGGSAELVLILGEDVSAMTRLEFDAAKDGEVRTYILVREGHEPDPAVVSFLDAESRRTAIRRFANVAEMESHLFQALRAASVQDSQQQSLLRRRRVTYGTVGS